MINNNVVDKSKQNRLEMVGDKQIGMYVIKEKEWTLPIDQYSIHIEIIKEKNLNIIEEFIIKIALSNVEQVITQDTIQTMLGLDEIFIETYIKRLTDVGVIDKKMLPHITITPIGKKQFEKGQVLIQDKLVKLSAYIEPHFKLFYKDIWSGNDNKDIEMINELDYDDVLTAEEIMKTPELMDKIIEIAKEEKLVIKRDSINQYIGNIRDIRILNTGKQIRFREQWFYDLIEETLFCRVWDYEKESYNEVLSQYITENRPLTIQDFDVEEYLHTKDVTNQGLVSKYESQYKEEIIKEKSALEKGIEKDDKQKKKNTALTIQMVRGEEIKVAFTRYLRQAKKYLFIQSPWISEKVVDEEMINMFKKLASAGCKIFISWGIAKTMDKEDRKPSQELIETLREIKRKDGMPGVFIYWIGNHHNKEIIVDKAHLAGSFNWLSYRGDYLPRGESVYINQSKEAIDEAKSYWEKLIFEKVTTSLWKEDYVREIHTLLNLETLQEEVKEVMLDEVNKVIKKKTKQSKEALFNIVLVYFKNKVVDEVMEKAIGILLDNKMYVKELFIILNTLKMNNEARLYNEFIDKYASLFIEEEIMNKDKKVTKDFNKKDLADKIVFV